MQVSISGQNIAVGNVLQEYVKGHITSAVNKYFEHAPSANVHFIKQGYQIMCDIIINDGAGRHSVFKGSASSDEIYTAFDNCLVKASTQLKKFKSKLKNHKHDRVKISEIISE